VDFEREGLSTKLRNHSLCFFGNDDECVEGDGVVKNPFNRMLAKLLVC
jgi:hypothetical protein